MSNLFTRSITGIVFSLAVLGATYYGQLALGILFLVFASVGLYEVYELARHKESNEPRWFAGMFVGVTIYLLVFLVLTNSIDSNWLWSIAFLIPSILCFELVKLDNESLTKIAVTFFGWIYAILPFALVNAVPLVNGTYEYEILLGFFVILWSNDTGAYFVGKFFGKRKLYPKVSPNKTWEGLFGGVILCFSIAFLFSEYFVALTRMEWLVMALIVAVFGNLGDLFESQLKRSFQVKDSGKLIPGHGGVLDRFDGLLIALPVLLAFLILNRIL